MILTYKLSLRKPFRYSSVFRSSMHIQYVHDSLYYYQTCFSNTNCLSIICLEISHYLKLKQLKRIWKYFIIKTQATEIDILLTSPKSTSFKENLESLFLIADLKGKWFSKKKVSCSVIAIQGVLNTPYILTFQNSRRQMKFLYGKDT